MSTTDDATFRRPRTGGTPAPAPDVYRSEILRDHGLALAKAAAARFYEVWPELNERFGQRGREHTYEDNFWHLSTLDTALAAKSPKVLQDYVKWLRDFLAARHVGPELTAANFVFLKEHLAALALRDDQEEERAELVTFLDAALELFPPELRLAPKRST